MQHYKAIFRKSRKKISQSVNSCLIKISIDTNKSSLTLTGKYKSIEAGPFELGKNERLKLRVFVDKSIIEVFANGRQAVVRRIYPTRKDSVGVSLFSKGGTAKVKTLGAWDIMPSNPY